MQRLITITLWLALALAHHCSWALTIDIPKFGTPVVSDDRLIFSEPGLSPHRVICVSRQDGTKLWELRDAGRPMRAWLAPGEASKDDFVITRGGDVYFCSPQGKTTLAYASGQGYCSVQPFQGSRVLVEARSENSFMGSLRMVDLAEGKKLWSLPETMHLIAQRDDIAVADRVNKSWTDQRLTVFSLKDGHVLWELRHPGLRLQHSCHIVGPYLVTGIDECIFCYDLTTGKLVNSLNMGSERRSTLHVTAGKDDREILAWTNRSGALSSWVVYRVALPSLKCRLAAKTSSPIGLLHKHDPKGIPLNVSLGRVRAGNTVALERLWRYGMWNWRGVHEHQVYFGAMLGAENAVVIKIDLTSGRESILYLEELPEKLKWPDDLGP